MASRWCVQCWCRGGGLLTTYCLLLRHAYSLSDAALLLTTYYLLLITLHQLKYER